MTDDQAGSSTVDGGGVTQVGDPLGLDPVLETLANRRRRFALYALADAAGGVISLADLFEEVATLIAALDEVPLTRELYSEIATDLYHWHLPVLADVGLIDYDTRRGTLRYHEDSTLATWLRRVKAAEIG